MYLRQLESALNEMVKDLTEKRNKSQSEVFDLTMESPDVLHQKHKRRVRKDGRPEAEIPRRHVTWIVEVPKVPFVWRLPRLMEGHDRLLVKGRPRLSRQRFSVSLCFQPVTPGGVGGRDVTDTVTDTVTLLELRPSLSGDQEVLLRYSASPDYPPLELVAYLPDFPFACGREFVFEFRQHKDYFAVSVNGKDIRDLHFPRHDQLPVSHVGVAGANFRSLELRMPKMDGNDCSSDSETKDSNGKISQESNTDEPEYHADECDADSESESLSSESSRSSDSQKDWMEDGDVEQAEDPGHGSSSENSSPEDTSSPSCSTPDGDHGEADSFDVTMEDFNVKNITVDEVVITDSDQVSGQVAEEHHGNTNIPVEDQTEDINCPIDTSAGGHEEKVEREGSPLIAPIDDVTATQGKATQTQQSVCEEEILCSDVKVEIEKEHDPSAEGYSLVSNHQHIVSSDSSGVDSDTEAHFTQSANLTGSPEMEEAEPEWDEPPGDDLETIEEENSTDLDPEPDKGRSDEKEDVSGVARDIRTTPETGADVDIANKNIIPGQNTDPARTLPVTSLQQTTALDTSSTSSSEAESMTSDIEETTKVKTGGEDTQSANGVMTRPTNGITGGMSNDSYPTIHASQRQQNAFRAERLFSLDKADLTRGHTMTTTESDFDMETDIDGVSKDTYLSDSVFLTQAHGQVICMRGLNLGRSVMVEGTVNKPATSIGLLPGRLAPPRGDVHMLMTVSLKEGTITCNSYLYEEWGTAVVLNKCPFVKGRKYALRIEFQANSFEIFHNNVSLLVFDHRAPWERISHLLQEGDSTFDKFQCPYEKPLPSILQVPEGLRVGHEVIFDIFIHDDAESYMYATEISLDGHANANKKAGYVTMSTFTTVCFEIHLQTGAKPRWSTSAFLAKVSFPSHDITAVECVDMHRGKKGEKTTVDGNLPIYRHRHCIVKIIVEADCYTFEVDGQFFVDHEHMVPPQKLTHVVMDGDVSLYSLKLSKPRGRRMSGIHRISRGIGNDCCCIL